MLIKGRTKFLDRVLLSVRLSVWTSRSSATIKAIKYEACLYCSPAHEVASEVSLMMLLFCKRVQFVKRYTRFVDNYVTDKPFSCKVYIFLISITTRVNLTLSACMNVEIAGTKINWKGKYVYSCDIDATQVCFQMLARHLNRWLIFVKLFVMLISISQKHPITVASTLFEIL